jgi:hypothetical protein
MKSLKILMIIFLPLWSCMACAAGKAVNVKLKVVDESNHPVVDAKVAMGFLLSKGANGYKGITDQEGKVEATENAAFGVSMRIQKNNFYKTEFRTGYGDQDLTLVLREKKNPIAMYAKSVQIISPVQKEYFGYDFIIGDYVAPYGKGKITDLLFKIKSTRQDVWNSEYYSDIKFNKIHDGLVPFFITHSSSDYPSDYLAPESGYEDTWSFKEIQVRDQPDDTNFNNKRSYYFRVRTVTNDKGEIISAHYGKIYGEFGTQQTYYFNPTPNDRNVEYNVQRNLFKNSAARGEWVSKP